MDIFIHINKAMYIFVWRIRPRQINNKIERKTSFTKIMETTKTVEESEQEQKGLLFFKKKKKVNIIIYIVNNQVLNK